jgi:hypothetical protein
MNSNNLGHSPTVGSCVHVKNVHISYKAEDSLINSMTITFPRTLLHVVGYAV